MPNLSILETFRTKEELINYFKEMGQTLTEKEIEALKQSYEQDEKNNEQLNLQQLDDIAGGAFLYSYRHVVTRGGKQAEVTTLINGGVPSTRTVFRDARNGGSPHTINPSGKARIFAPPVAENATPEMTMAQLLGVQPHEVTIVVQGEQAQALYSSPNYLPIYPNIYHELTGARGDENTPLFIPLFPEVSTYTTDGFVDITIHLLTGARDELQRRANNPREARYLTEMDKQQLENLDRILPFYTGIIRSRTFA